MIAYLLAAFLFISFPAGVRADPADAVEANPPVREIIDRAVARASAQFESSVEAGFESESTTRNRKFDGDGLITDDEILKQRQYPLHGAVFEELLEKNGHPLTPKEHEKVEEQKRDFIREVDRRRIRGDYLQPEKNRAVRFDRAFAEKYRYEMVRTETVRNYRCWVIAFKPGEGELPVRSKMDRALNQLTGQLWVSQDDYGLVRVDFAMRKPFKYWGGLLAIIRKTDGNAEYTRVGPDVWLPLHFELELDIRIMLLKNIRMRITKDWHNYRRARNLESPNAPSDTDTR